LQQFLNVIDIFDFLETEYTMLAVFGDSLN
jgi:hypothetical protein